MRGRPKSGLDRKTYSVYVKPGLLEEARRTFDVNSLLEKMLMLLINPKTQGKMLATLNKEMPNDS